MLTYRISFGSQHNEEVLVEKLCTYLSLLWHFVHFSALCSIFATRFTSFVSGNKFWRDLVLFTLCVRNSSRSLASKSSVGATTPGDASSNNNEIESFCPMPTNVHIMVTSGKISRVSFRLCQSKMWTQTLCSEAVFGKWSESLRKAFTRD